MAEGHYGPDGHWRNKPVHPVIFFVGLLFAGAATKVTGLLGGFALIISGLLDLPGYAEGFPNDAQDVLALTIGVPLTTILVWYCFKYAEASRSYGEEEVELKRIEVERADTDSDSGGQNKGPSPLIVPRSNPRPYRR